MKKDWLWDRRISLAQAKKILSNPGHQRFISLAALLLVRKNSPREVFTEYLSPEDFCQYWLKIKRKMRKNVWQSARTIFWQVVYEKVLEKLKKKGLSIKSANTEVDSFLRHLGEQIKTVRVNKRLTQSQLAKKLGVSQQIVSRIEKGRQNVSVLTLKEVVDKLNARINLDIRAD